MELSARDKRILAEIECASALEDPKWARRLERLTHHSPADPRPRGRTRGRASRRAVRSSARIRSRSPLTIPARLLLTVLWLAWIAALVVGVTLLHPMLWAALAIGGASYAAWLTRRRRIFGHWFRHPRRISRIPRQAAPGHGDAED